MAYIPRLKDEYKNRVISALKEEFGYTNVMQVPKLQKIVLSDTWRQFYDRKF